MRETADWTAERLRVPVARWLDVLREEYLNDYLTSGGSAVRFVSGSPEALDEVRRTLARAAVETGCYHAELDCGQLTSEGKRPDYHRIEKFFFGVTAEIDWSALAARQAREFLRKLGLQVAEDRPLADLDAIAADNGRDATDLIGEYQQRVATRMVQDRSMEYEFRAAVTALGRAQLVPDSVIPTTEEVLRCWFAGRTMPGGQAALKKIHIFERIGPANARHMLRSCCRWLPRVGYHGLVVTLDFRAYEAKRRGQAGAYAELQRRLRAATDSGLTAEDVRALVFDGEAPLTASYSDRAYLEMLSLLRRFIDEIEQFDRFLLVVLTTPDFYRDDSPRHYWHYDALQTRIGLEVRDAHRANPAAALVHLGDES